MYNYAYLSDYDDFADAINSLETIGDPVVLYIDEDADINADEINATVNIPYCNQDIPARAVPAIITVAFIGQDDVKLTFEPGTPDQDSRLVFLGPFHAPLSQVFELNNTAVLVFSNVDRVIPHWFGALPETDAIADELKYGIKSAALSRKELFFPAGTYRINSQSNPQAFGNAVTVEFGPVIWTGEHGSTIRYYAPATGDNNNNVFKFDPYVLNQVVCRFEEIRIRGLDLIGGGDANEAAFRARFFRIQSANRVEISNCTFRDAGGGMYIFDTNGKVNVDSNVFMRVENAIRVGATSTGTELTLDPCENGILRANIMRDIGLGGVRGQAIKLSMWPSGGPGSGVETLKRINRMVLSDIVILGNMPT